MGPAAVGNRLRKEGILGTFPKVTEAQLKEALNDPAWQARQGVIDPAVPTNRVVCLECRELKCELNANGNHSHLAGKHHMPAAEYKRNHPGARLVSFKRSAAQNTRQGRTKTIQDLMAEDAEAYVTPEIWKAVARDEEWEEHKGIMKFVVCRMRSPQGYRCGFKSKSDLHLHLKAWHGLTSAEYRELFPKALQLPLGAYPAKNKIAKTYADRRRKEISELKASDKRLSELEAEHERRAWRPAGWNKKRAEWRMLGDELMSRDGVTNLELATKFSTHFARYGRTPKQISDNRGFVNLVFRVRHALERKGKQAPKKASN
jgi:predicted transcriptional regulator